jgi:hypothetical protein
MSHEKKDEKSFITFYCNLAALLQEFDVVLGNLQSLK